MISLELFKTLIKEGQELIAQVDINQRELELEEQGRYVFVGIRQAGKSYLLYQQAKQLITSGFSVEDMLYIDFDDERLLGMTAEHLDLMLQAYALLYINHHPILLLDEIQNIDGWEHFARRMANQKYRIYITGSNAKMLSRDIQTTLGGRYWDQMVFPYSFREWLAAQSIIPADNWQYSKQRLLIAQKADEYLTWGGYPELLLYSGKRSWLNSLYEKILLGDVIQRNAIRNEQAIRMAIKRIAETVRQPMAYNRLANLIKSTGVSTNATSMIQYVDFVKDACMLFTLDNYASKFVEKETSKKHYFIDNGLLNIFLSNRETSLLENLCAIQLYKRYKNEVYYYRDNIEVDFYVPKQQLAIQACYSLSEDHDSSDTFHRETEALVKFNRYQVCNRNLIITHNEEQNLNIDGLNIEVIPFWKWLLE